MSNRLNLFLFAFMLLALACTPEKVPAGGSGGSDASGNDGGTVLTGNLRGTVKDATTGEPIAGVPVTDGYSYTLTDEDGRYSLQSNELTRTVYLSVPAEYEIPTDADHHPAFYRNGDFNDKDKVYTNDFELIPRTAEADRFMLAGIADIHIYEDGDLDRFSQETVPDLMNALTALSNESYKECIAVFAGDQMSDNMQMVSDFKESLARHYVGDRKLVFLYCIGNHDFANSDLKDLEATSYNASRTYVGNFGPTDYSLNIGKVHIVVMNNIIVTGKDVWTRDHQIQCVEYKAGFTDSQLEWLKRDLSFVKNPQDKAVVFVCHVPLKNSGAANYQAVAQLLTQFGEAHILSGHTHTLDNYIHNRVCRNGKKLYEHNLQMACGTWWKARLSVDGTPTGYGLFRFSGAKLFDSCNKGTGMDADVQLRVYSGNDVYDGKTQGGGQPKHDDAAEWPETLKGKFIVRVWDADADNWEVEFVKGDVSVPMDRCTGVADECTYAFCHNILDTPFGSKSTYYAKSSNFWCIDAPSGDPAAETGWKVVATHKFSSIHEKKYEADRLQRDYSGFALD